MVRDRLSISYRKFNPNFHHLKRALYDDNVRFIFMYGGSSSSKSFSLAQAILLSCLSHGYNTRVYRKTGATILESIYKTFREAAGVLGIAGAFVFKENKIECFNSSYVTFSGLDDPEKIKGLESYQFVVCEELSDFDEADFKQIKKRLRGRPGQKIISMFNPITEEHWIKKHIFDRERLNEVPNSLYGLIRDEKGNVLPEIYTAVSRKWVNSEITIPNPRTGEVETHPADTVILLSTYLQNFWVVGSPDGTYGFYDRQAVADFEKDKTRDYEYYRVYALGQWGSIRTGGEFLHAFNTGRHKGKYPYLRGLPVHVSVDNNVLPYISVTFFQADGKSLRQVHEICAEDPFNTVTKAAELARAWLEDVGYDDAIFLHGDASTRSGNTIDEEKRSFLDKFIEGLEKSFRVIDCVPSSNPPVALSGEFLNAILSDNIYGLSIGIDESCGKSVRDYENVKKDVNGAILKMRTKNKVTGQSYEEFGHLTDTLRYVCADVFRGEFREFSLKGKRSVILRDGGLLFFDTSKPPTGERFAFVLPDSRGKFVLLTGYSHDYVDVDSVIYRDSFDESLLRKSLPDCTVVFECDRNFYNLVRDLRERWDVKVRKMPPNHAQRIEAYKDFIKGKVRFRNDYSGDSDYTHFIEDVTDYEGGGNDAAANALSAVASYFIKRA